MQWSTKLGLSLTVVALGIAALVTASCGPHNGAGHGASGGTGGGGAGGTGGAGASGGGSGGCVGLQCQQMQCPGGGTTSLTGKVFAVQGGSIQELSGWSVADEIETDDPWTIADIAARLERVRV